MSSQGQDTFRQVTSIIQQLSPVNIAAVREHVMELLTSPTTSLKPKSGTSYDNHGNESQVMILDGTVPITYMGGRYNIPIEMYIGKRYPEVAPSVYVRPTPTMRVKQDHDTVAVDGTVYIHMLTNWRSNNRLTELYQMLSSVFSANPPLFSAPTSTPPPPPVVAHGSTVPASSSADPPSSEKIVKLQTMMQATEETEQTCQFYLEMMGWDLPSAMEEYQQSTKPRRESAPAPAPAPAPDSVSVSVPAPKRTSSNTMTNNVPEKEPTLYHQTFQIAVPEGVTPGTSFGVIANGQLITVNCPPDTRPGEKIRFDIPVSPGETKLMENPLRL